MKKICVVTATRAEYGLLRPVIDKLASSEDIELQLVVTGMHLSPEFGLTYREIEEDGYPIRKKIEMLLSSDTEPAITKSMAVALMGFADFFADDRPDIVVILGDRYEMLMTATAAMIAKIPIAHIHGGELTEGAYDDAIRHSITKMSQLHFASTEEYQRRIIQLGECPERVFNVGALGVESIKKIKLLSKEELEKNLNFSIQDNTFVVTYHPVTLETFSSEVQFSNLLQVIDRHQEWKVIFTKANADTDGRIINRMIDEYVGKHNERCIAFSSLGQLRYLSVLQYCSAVVGNSSSGIIEVPSFHIPTINIGNRQQGRITGGSVIHCGYESSEIEEAINKALSSEFMEMIKGYMNPYEGINTSEKIVGKIKEVLAKGIDTKKKFYDIKVSN
ncbi:MAG: UDP-N-acetylglucosamine 2-epimerase (hydrolyzing) [Lachnospiraceae bacterium]|nr:UDP-N-acetylglucosamine 2-epimerase (hydrolyzing) [Lachnospiraceae bacterium]